MIAAGRFKALAWMVTAMAVTAAFYAGARWIAEMSPFVVEKLDVAGNVRTPPEAILAAAGLAPGQPLFGEGVDVVAARVRQLPWVREARVERRLPDAVVVNVREWEPRYLVRLEGRLYYMTPEAHVVDAPLGAGLDFPVVTGLGWVQFEAPGPFRDELLALLALLDGGAFGSRLDEIHADPDEGFTLYGALPRPYSAHLGRGDLEEKFARLGRMRRTLTTREQFARSADLSFEDRIVARLEPLRPVGALP